MGRKPNALILQHFERGEKLNDSSNRYQHTCKSCGEKFLKGRIDSLMTHLFKKCPAISQQDRQKALLESHGLSNNSQNNNSGGVQMNGPTVELPISLRQNPHWTPLETLAEVSRQFGDSEQPEGNQAATVTATAPNTQKTDQLEVREQYTLDNPPVSYEQHIQRGKKVSAQKPAQIENNGLVPQTTFAQANFPNLSASRPTSPNLAMAASSMAAAQAARSYMSPEALDPQLMTENSHQFMAGGAHGPVSEDASLQQQLEEASGDMTASLFESNDQHGQWIMDSTLYNDSAVGQSMHGGSPAASSYAPMAMTGPLTTEFTTEYGNGARANKPKVRGKFDNSRRQEVQEVRKVGACIRCRMLKKTCSLGSPCDQCGSIEAARLWKTPCIRTRVATLLDMYALGLHSILARQDSNSQKNSVKFSTAPFHIDATHYPETGMYVTLKAIKGQRILVDGNIDPGLSGDFSTTTVRMLDDDNDDVPLKIEGYTKRMLPTFIEKEQSHFTRVTLNAALALTTTNTVEASGLLTRVLDLWACVHILVDGGGWNFYERPDIEAQLAGHGPLIDRTLHPKTVQLLIVQLEAAAEKKAAQLSKAVITDMERDLLLAKSARSFSHFIVGIILMICIEKSTWLFQSWEQEEFKSRWPLDKKPSHFTSQGDKVADFLQMLLKHRNILPKIYQKADGTIGTDVSQEFGRYFDDCQMNYAHVLNQQNNFVFDKSDSSSYAFRFVSKLFI